MSYLLSSAHAVLPAEPDEKEYAGEGVVEWSMTGIDQRLWCAGPEAGGLQPTTPHTALDRTDTIIILFTSWTGMARIIHTFQYGEMERYYSSLFLYPVFLHSVTEDRLLFVQSLLPHIYCQYKGPS